MNYRDIREDYDTDGCDPADLGDDPVAAASIWLDAAIDAGVPQANAISLATVSADGQPSVRTVLLKGIDEGFVFYTNYESAKGRDISATGVASISLTWVQMHRQIRAKGRVERVAPELSDAYFASRPHGAQVAALASAQSAELADRSILERRVEELTEQFPETVPRPPNWGGYRLVPTSIEFWQGRRSRLHDRIEFVRSGSGWQVRRLWP